MLQLNKREEGRVRVEIRNAQQSIARLTEEINGNENNIFKAQQKMEALMQEMDWNTLPRAAGVC